MSSRVPGASDPIARNAVFALGSQATTALLTAGLTVYLVRALGPSEYGVFALAIGFATLMLLPADFGVSQSAARFVAERRGDPRAVAAVLAAALRLKLVLTTGFALLLVLLAEPVASIYGEPALVWPLRLVAISLLGQSVMLLFMNAFVAMGRVAFQFRLVLLESLTEVTATVALVVLAGGAAAAAGGRAVGFVAGGLLGVVLALRLIGSGAASDRRGGVAARRLGGYAGALLIVDGAFAFFSQIDLLMVGALLGPAAAGIYAAPIKLSTLIHYPGLAVSNAIAPRLARQRGRAPDAASFARGLRYMVIFQTAAVAPIVVWAEPIASLVLGSGFEESASILRALAPFIFLKGLGPLVSVSVNYMGEARRRIPIAIGSILLNLALVVALVETIGIVGAAVAVDIAYAVYFGAHLWVCRGLIDLPLRPLGLTLARTAVAGLGFAAVLLLFGTTALDLVDWLGGAIGGLLAFTLILVAMRELEPRELWTVPRGIVRGMRARA